MKKIIQRKVSKNSENKRINECTTTAYDEIYIDYTGTNVFLLIALQINL